MFFGNRPMTGKEHQALLSLLVSLLTLAIFAALFVLRSNDDNRLTSWQWVFDVVDIRLVFLALTIAVAIAFAVSRISFPVRGRSAMLFVSSFAASAMFWGEPEVIIDAARYFTQAKYLEQFGVWFFLGEWGRDIPAWTDLPLTSFLQGLVFTLLGETRMGVQAFTTLLFSGTVVLTYRIGRSLWDETLGASAGILLLAMPYLLTQPALMLADIPTMFFLTLAVFTTIRATTDGRVGFLMAAPVAITLAMASKYSAWLMLSVVPIIFLAHIQYGRRAVFRRAAVMTVGMVLLAGTAVLMKFDVVATQWGLLWSYQMRGLARWGESHASTFFFQIHPFVTAAALCSVYIAFARRDPKYAVIGWMLLLVMLLGIRRARYVLITFPMLALMAAYALREIEDGRIRRFIVSSAVASALVTAVFGYLPFLKGTSAMNLMEAGEYLDTLQVEKVEVFTLPQARSIINPAISVPILDLFTKKRIIYRDHLISPPAQTRIEASPLRFTWEFKTPSFFAPEPEPPREATAVVVIASRSNQPLPPGMSQRIAGFQLAKEFAVSDQVFKFKTIVSVYHPP